MHMKNVHFKNNKVTNNTDKNTSKPKCDFCNKQFFDISTLSRHCKNVHFVVLDTRRINNDENTLSTPCLIST